MHTHVLQHCKCTVVLPPAAMLPMCEAQAAQVGGSLSMIPSTKAQQACRKCTCIPSRSAGYAWDVPPAGHGRPAAGGWVPEVCPARTGSCSRSRRKLTCPMGEGGRSPNGSVGWLWMHWMLPPTLDGRGFACLTHVALWFPYPNALAQPAIAQTISPMDTAIMCS